MKFMKYYITEITWYSSIQSWAHRCDIGSLRELVNVREGGFCYSEYDVLSYQTVYCMYLYQVDITCLN